MLISSEKKEVVKSLLLDGRTLDEVAEEVGISRRSVVNIKNELIKINPETAQIISENKSNTLLKKKEVEITEKLSKEKALFEDVEEGWIYHITAEEWNNRLKSLWWIMIVYPESAPKGWEEKLKSLGIQMAISPLHDKDVWTHDSPEVVDEETGEIIEKKGSKYKSGDRKKSHYHVILKFEKLMGYKEVNTEIRPITNSPYLQKCYSLKGQYEYLIHLNHPDRYQYEKDEIRTYNGFFIEPNMRDRMILVDEIGKTIAENKFTDIEQVRQYYEGQIEYINVISLKGFYFEKLTQVWWRKKNPDGRKQLVKIVYD